MQPKRISIQLARRKTQSSDEVSFRWLDGTHGFIHSSTGKFSIFPVDNVSITNQKREELGLPEVSDKTGEITMPEPRQMPITN